jgi:glyoxylase-like metal-dependent hydrolase (beta-lactamase superfamily II)
VTLPSQPTDPPSQPANPSSQPAAADEQALLAKAAEIGIHRLAIPTPFGVGRVNCYLVEDDPLTLLDSGPNSATSLTVLEAALAERGRRVEELQRIVVTHQHIDHIGLVDILAKRSGAEVCALDRLAPWLADFKREMEAGDVFSAQIMLRNGIPQDVVYALRAVSASFRAWGASAQVTRPLRDGDALEFADRSWRVHHRPGHSPSDTVFHDERAGVLLGGDHLIKHISSNPLIALPLPDERAEDGGDDARTTPGERVDNSDGSSKTPGEHAYDARGGRPRALMTYLDSLRRTRAMDLSLVLAGHGDPIDDHRALIDERLRMHARRAEKLRRLIEERPRNAYELAQEMWGNVAVTQAFLTLSEVLGHVDLLLSEGAVREHEDDGVRRFRPA